MIQPYKIENLTTSSEDAKSSSTQGSDSTGFVNSLNKQDFLFDNLWFSALDELEGNFSFIKSICQENARVEDRAVYLRENFEKRKAEGKSTENIMPKGYPIEGQNYTDKDYEPLKELQSKYLSYLGAILNLDRTMSVFSLDAKNRRSDDMAEKFNSYYLDSKNNFQENASRLAHTYSNRNNEAVRKLISQNLMQVRYLNLDLPSVNRDKKNKSDVMFFKFLIDMLEQFTIFFSKNLPAIEKDMIKSVDTYFENKMISNYINRFVYFDMDGLVQHIDKNIKFVDKLDGMLGSGYGQKFKNISDFYKSLHKAKMNPVEPYIKIRNEIKKLTSDANNLGAIKNLLAEHKDEITKAIAYSNSKTSLDWEVREFSETFSSINKNIKLLAKSNLDNSKTVWQSGVLKTDNSVDFLLKFGGSRISGWVSRNDEFWTKEIIASNDEQKQKIARGYIISSLTGALRDKKMDAKITIAEIGSKIIEAPSAVKSASVIAFSQELEKLKSANNCQSLKIMHEIFPFICKELKVPEYKLKTGKFEASYIIGEYCNALKKFMENIKKNINTDKALASIEKIDLLMNISAIAPPSSVKNKI